jgi:hypothetical protein
MANHRVVLEIEVEANTPLEAAKEIQSWLDAADNKWCFYVQKEGSDKVFCIDLSEDDEDAVQETNNHIPMIK